jgi:site-specific DNA recombinase
MQTVFYGRAIEPEAIQSQIRSATNYSKIHQLPIQAWYLDEGISRTIPLELRPEGKRLLKDANAGKFDTLLVYCIDQLGHTIPVANDITHQLQNLGVKVISITKKAM